MRGLILLLEVFMLYIFSKREENILCESENPFYDIYANIGGTDILTPIRNLKRQEVDELVSQGMLKLEYDSLKQHVIMCEGPLRLISRKFAQEYTEFFDDLLSQVVSQYQIIITSLADKASIADLANTSIYYLSSPADRDITVNISKSLKVLPKYIDLAYHSFKLYETMYCIKYVDAAISVNQSQLNIFQLDKHIDLSLAEKPSAYFQKEIPG